MDWSPRRSNNKKKGYIYFINKYTGEKVWNRDLYSPKTEPNSYTIINTLDGQVKIPEDALPGLNEWSGLISMITTYKGEETPTFNVSSSYLIRLISISRASAQYFSLDDELKEKKRQQIVRMFDAHNRDEFTRFYDEEMEMTGKLSEFTEAIGVAEIKLNVKYSNQWTIPSDVLMYSIGLSTVDTMDPTFTDAQYTTIAALSYLQHLKDTNPESVKGLTITPILLENEHLYIDHITKTKITTWVPLHIIINDTINDTPDKYIEPLQLAFVERNELKYHSLSDINIFIDQKTRRTLSLSPKVIEFWKGLYRFHHKCKIPVTRRVWLE